MEKIVFRHQEIETLPLPQLKELQRQKLQKTVEAALKTPFVRIKKTFFVKFSQILAICVSEWYNNTECAAWPNALGRTVRITREVVYQ